MCELVHFIVGILSCVCILLFLSCLYKTSYVEELEFIELSVGLSVFQMKTVIICKDQVPRFYSGSKGDIHTSNTYLQTQVNGLPISQVFALKGGQSVTFSPLSIKGNVFQCSISLQSYNSNNHILSLY